MASLISKLKKNKLYYYVVESARVEGKPRIVQQTYLGTAERVAALSRTVLPRCPSPRLPSSSACPALSG